jgi:prepilin-type N-terminal cleavage/methylation domain-containing protein
MKVKNSRKAGFTLVEIMIVVAIIGLLAAIAIPNFVRARQTSQTNACINNLRQIDGAKQQWALEQGKVTSDTPSWAGNPSVAIQAYLGRGDAGSLENVYCPISATKTAAASYTMNDVGTAPVCNQTDTTTHNAVLQ